MRNRSITKILLFIIVILFLFGITRLFIMRFEHGDVYPVYSSLRSDPLGTKIFYESLNEIEEISVNRNYESETKMKDTSAAAIFYFGMAGDSLKNVNEDEIKVLEGIVSNGGRLVLTLYPEKSSPNKTKKEVKDLGTDTRREQDQKNEEHEICSASARLTERWGFDMGFSDKYVTARNDHKAEKAIGNNYLYMPVSVSWHSGIYFDKKDEEWNDVYLLEGMPVVIERKYGNGTIVLSSDSYFVSNEALKKERHSGLLAWLAGNNKKIVFDETHFGIYENPGISALARKYRLHGFFAGVIVLAVLFVWKNSLSLLPLKQEDDSMQSSEPSEGKDYIAGFVSLLKKNINKKELLTFCFQEWKRSFYHKKNGLDEDMKKIQTIIESDSAMQSKNRDIVGAYLKISKILIERKYK